MADNSIKKISIVPFGPQHPVLPEPIHLDLVLQDEKVIDALPSIGFVHRGLEKLVEKRDFQDFVLVAERTCGICSFGHGLGYVEAVEKIMHLETTPRTKYLRTMWAELGRMHNHLMWLGLLADAFGFESLFMETWRLREKVLDLLELTTGGRVIFSVNKVGGLRKDVTKGMLDTIMAGMTVLTKECRVATDTFLGDRDVQSRMRGVGRLSPERAEELGCCGPFLRASGVRRDLRLLGYEAYGELQFEPIVSFDGDCYARCEVRIKELYQSMDLVRQCIEKMPDGPIEVPVKGNPNGEYMARIEQPRGEALYYVKANGTKFLTRYRNRTPTYSNIPGLVETIKGAELADVAMMILTIDPCISCTER
ncbi:ech hydrogenase subunit E [Lachnospiraceae bacterium NK3A20]|nr:ech hydrogenase subunit E [Lachnospiraceae bacterium NK3A20]